MLHDPDVKVRFRAAESLIQLGKSTPEVIAVLIEALSQAKNWYQHRHYIKLLSSDFLEEDKTILKAIWNEFLYNDDDVRKACVIALMSWNSRFPSSFKNLETKLIRALKNPRFEKLDNIKRPAFDYMQKDVVDKMGIVFKPKDDV